MYILKMLGHYDPKKEGKVKWLNWEKPMKECSVLWL
jgi:hypothetical protein